MKKIRAVAKATALAMLALGGVAAFAGDDEGTVVLNLFGRDYEVRTWYVRFDTPIGFSEPEGMTFYNGKLYIGTDDNNTQGWLITYTPGPTGDLTAWDAIEMSLTCDLRNNIWGPEGITVNTSGVGYGAFTVGEPVFVTVDSRGDDRIATVDTNTSPAYVCNIGPVPNPDDIAYVPSLGQFVTLEDRDVDGIWALFHTHDSSGLTGIVKSWVTQDLETKGLCVIPAQAANWMLCRTDLTGEYLLMSSTVGVPGTVNKLWIYDFDGNVLGETEFSPPGWGELESVAYDPDNHLVYAGSEDTNRIHVFQIRPQATLDVSVTLQNFGSPLGQSATLELRNPGETTPQHTYPITLDAAGNVTLPCVAEGTWDVAVKFSHWLRAVVASKTIAAGSNSVSFVQVNGDADNDNAVGLADLNAVLVKFGQADVMTDLDGSGLTDLADLNIVLLNFGKQGQP
ncbi:MAG: hypothetical protein HRF45_07465 [Fimbriimonadia bacterium]